MIVRTKDDKEVDICILELESHVRWWEDSAVNGLADYHGYLIPFKKNDCWSPKIKIDTGQIIGWPLGKVAKLNYKTRDENNYRFLNEFNEVILEKQGYVIESLSILREGYGDYVSLEIDEWGVIKNWNFLEKDFNFLNND